MDACLMLAETGSLGVVIGILKVALALGFVIFVHELGHFGVAKMCGVQCDKFFVGFDIGGYKLSRKWGETEYGIGILPLGGYVKMLGQDDDPSKLAEQMKEAQDAAEGLDESNTKLVTGPSGEKYRVDRRSYQAKAVWQRMLIISAGVIMNLIFGLLFAVLAFGLGAEYNPCVIGSVAPGSPAYLAGLETGDELLELNERKSPDFNHLLQSVTLGDRKEGIRCLVKKHGSGEEKELVIKPALKKEGARIGVGPSAVNQFSRFVDPTESGSPAAKAEFKKQDEIVAINGDPVSDYPSLRQALSKHRNATIEVAIRRIEEKSKGAEEPTYQDLVMKVEPSPLKRIGVKATIGPITAVLPGGPGDKAGLKTGDIITAINGRSLGEASGPGEVSWDPITLPYTLSEESGDLAFSIKRGEESLDVTVTPLADQPLGQSFTDGAPVSLADVGITYQVVPNITTVVEGSPAADSLRPGDQVISAAIVPPKESEAKKKTVEFSEEKPNWPFFMTLLQGYSLDSEVVLKVKRGEETVTARMKPYEDEAIGALSRGFRLQPLLRVRPVESFSDAVSLGCDRMVNDMGTIFRVLSRLGSKEVPLNNLAGPIGILTIAYKQAESGLAPLLLFLTMLSANLAVLNFLPIPVLDGGHMVFLAWEGITGKPANEKVVLALHMVGFVLLISLMLFTVGNDLFRLFST